MYTRWWYSFVPIRMHVYFYPIYLIGLPHLIFSLLPRRQAFPLAVFSVWLHGNIFWCAESSFLKNLLQPWQGCCSFRPQDGAPTWRGDARVQMRRLIKPSHLDLNATLAFSITVQLGRHLSTFNSHGHLFNNTVTAVSTPNKLQTSENLIWNLKYISEIWI